MEYVGALICAEPADRCVRMNTLNPLVEEILVEYVGVPLRAGCAQEILVESVGVLIRSELADRHIQNNTRQPK